MEDRKIGIVTLWDSPVNYGQVLQGYALSAILQEMGFQPFIVRYTLKEEIKHDTLWMKVRRVLTGKKSVSAILKRYTCKSEKMVNRRFDDFRKERMRYSERSYDSFDDLVKGYPKADIYVTGSDQVWGASGSNNKKRIFLLDFLPKEVRRIAYAASFGRNQIEDDEKDLFQTCLRKFSGISVREQTGCDICRCLGIQGTRWVLDPTLLLPRKKWMETFHLSRRSSKKKVVFAYMLTNDKNNKSFYQLFAALEKRGYEVRYVSSAYYLDEKATCSPTIEEWLDNMLNADLVITSSYHGTLFALNFNTPFIFIPKHKGKGGENSRLYTLLEALGLEGRIFLNGESLLDELLGETWDWPLVNEFLEEKRVESLDYLEEVLR